MRTAIRFVFSASHLTSAFYPVSSGATPTLAGTSFFCLAKIGMARHSECTAALS
jgi:hypothetical protein